MLHAFLLFVGVLIGILACSSAWAAEGYATFYTVKSCQLEGYLDNMK